MDDARVSRSLMFPFRGARSAQRETPTPQLWSGNILCTDVMLGQISRRKTTDSHREEEEEEESEGGSGASHNPLIRSRHVALFERGEATTNRLREGGAAD